MQWLACVSTLWKRHTSNCLSANFYGFCLKPAVLIACVTIPVFCRCVLSLAKNAKANKEFFLSACDLDVTRSGIHHETPCPLDLSPQREAKSYKRTALCISKSMASLPDKVRDCITILSILPAVEPGLTSLPGKAATFPDVPQQVRASEALGCCEECLPGRQTGAYPEQAVSDVSHHLVDLVRGQQLQGKGAPLVLDGQLQRGGDTVSARPTQTCGCRRRRTWSRKRKDAFVSVLFGTSAHSLNISAQSTHPTPLH